MTRPQMDTSPECAEAHARVSERARAGSESGVQVPTTCEAAAELCAPVSANEDGTESPSETVTVLLVDDDAQVRSVVMRMLVATGFSVMVARDGRQALRLLEAHRGAIGVVVTDINMPGMSGLELAAKLAQTFVNTKLILMSGNADHADESVAYGGFLPKPFTPEELAMKMQEAVGQGCC